LTIYIKNEETRQLRRSANCLVGAKPISERVRLPVLYAYFATE